tara:strand:+ start:213 stop:599 length:387 start_codon:yes stop_codon:yes gene_type:complete
MNKYNSLRLNLEEVVKDKDFELLVLENIRRASSITGKSFKVVFWYETLKESDIKKFIKRNEKLLFEINSRITKNNDYAWFTINSTGRDKSSSRYSWQGDILQGIVKYIDMIKYLRKREKDEDSNNWKP